MTHETKLLLEVQQRIEKEAHAHRCKSDVMNEDWTSFSSYKAGAQAEAERAMALVEALEDALAHTIHWEYKGKEACPMYMDTVRNTLSEALEAYRGESSLKETILSLGEKECRNPEET